MRKDSGSDLDDHKGHLLSRRWPFNPETVSKMAAGPGVVVLFAKGGRVLRYLDVQGSVAGELEGMILDYLSGDFDGRDTTPQEFSAIWEHEPGKRAQLMRWLDGGMEQLRPE